MTPRARALHRLAAGVRRTRGPAAVVAVAVVVSVVVLLIAGGGGQSVDGGRSMGRSGLPTTGWDPGQPGLRPAVVGGRAFALAAQVAVDGRPQGAPVVAGGIAVLATDTNDVYGVDAATGAVTWHRTLGPTERRKARGCAGAEAPVGGAAGTPVADAAAGIVYLAAATTTPRGPAYRVHALSIATGRERPGWPVTVQGAADNAANARFDAAGLRVNAALLRLGDRLYLGFGSPCGRRTWVAGVSVTAPRSTVRLWAADTGACSPCRGAVPSGAPLAADRADSLLVAVGGNAAPVAGDPGTTRGGAAVVRLHVAADGRMRAVDRYAAPAAASPRGGGQGDPLVLAGDRFGRALKGAFLLSTGPRGELVVLQRERLDRAVATIAPLAAGAGGRVDSRPAAWPGGDAVFVLTRNGTLQQVRLGRDAGRITSGVYGTATTNPAGDPGAGTGMPLVTSQGLAARSATVWAVSGGRAGTRLHAFAAQSAGGALTPLFTAPLPAAARFATPVAAAGRIYVASGNDGTGTPGGQLRIYASDPGAATRQYARAVYARLLGSALTRGVPALASARSTRTRTAYVRRALASRGVRRARVRQAYREVLTRDPTPVEQEDGVRRLAAGQPLERVVAALASSDAFLPDGAAPTRLVARWSARLCAGALADATRRRLGTELAAGASRAAVLAQVLDSPERARVLVRRAYARTLARLPDPGGLKTYTDLLRSGAPQEDVLVALAASPEFTALTRGG